MYFNSRIIFGTISIVNVMFIWSIWHRVVAVTSWRAMLIMDIDDRCHVCMNDIPETIAHKFCDCRVAHTQHGNSPLESLIP